MGNMRIGAYAGTLPVLLPYCWSHCGKEIGEEGMRSAVLSYSSRALAVKITGRGST